MPSLAVASADQRFAMSPMLLAGLAPFGVGTLLAGASGLPMRWGVWTVGLAATGALIRAAFAAREAFAPGSGRWPSWGGAAPDQARRQAYFSLLAAAFLGLLLQIGFHTGDLTIPLGSLGILGGYFSFAPPLSWHRRGCTEAAGALCFGLLPVAAGLYLQCGHLLSEILLYGLPLTFAGFNLFLLYGLPRPEAAAVPGTLGTRLKPASCALLYTIVNVFTIAALVLIVFFPAAPLPGHNWLWALLGLAVVNQELVKRQSLGHEARLRLLSRLHLTLQLGMSVIFLLMLWPRL